jgi:hypothetical protein
MFKKFQTGGMMNPQQGQMLPPDPQQMAPQPQGGAQLPPEVMQILMTLPENIRQYLLSLPPDQMMMELQKIMQEQMASQSSPLSQQQGQGQQGAPMPPQGGEQAAPPMMGKYGMKIKAKMGLTTDPKSKIDLGKMEDSSDIRLAQKKINPYLTTKPKTTTPTITPSVQPIVNPNAPKLGQKVMLSGKAATIDMVDGKLVFKYDDGSGIQEVRMAQTESISQNSIPVSNTNQVSVNSAQVPIQNFTTTPSVVTTKPRVTTTKPAQTNSSPTTGQQGITTNPTKKTTPAAKSKVTTNSNNTQWTDKQLNDEFMKGNIANPVTITAPKYLRDIVPYSPEYSDSNPNNDNTRFNSKQHELANLNNKIAILKDEEKKFLKAKRNGAGMISWKDSMEHKKITDKIDALYTERNKVEKSKKSYSAYKSGGQLPSALKISTPLKTIMDRKIEMYKSGGKMKLKTCKHGC